MTTNKLNQVLAKTEATNAQAKSQLVDYINFFKNDQGSFKGLRKTYEPIQGYSDIPKNRENKKVVTTVSEKLSYLRPILAASYDGQLTIEATNATGNARTELIVAGENWGEFSSLELMRIKTIISDPKLKEMIQRIPVRSDSREWTGSTADEYTDRDIVQTPTLAYSESTTEKEEIVLVDPNIQRAIEAGKDINYSPQTSVKTKKVTVGAGNFTEYSGEWTHFQRATTLKRIADLLVAVVEALQKANQAELAASNLTGDKLLDYIFNPA